MHAYIEPSSRAGFYIEPFGFLNHVKTCLLHSTVTGNTQSSPTRKIILLAIVKVELDHAGKAVLYKSDFEFILFLLAHCYVVTKVYKVLYM